MITLTQFYKMKKGDVFSHCNLFTGLSEEKLLWQCTKQSSSELLFSVSFIGVWVCNYKMYLNTKKDAVLIKEAK